MHLGVLIFLTEDCVPALLSAPPSLLTEVLLHDLGLLSLPKAPEPFSIRLIVHKSYYYHLLSHTTFNLAISVTAYGRSSNHEVTGEVW